MKLGVLFSGGKDSSYALYKASKYHEISCLITIKSDNKDSYMFHTPAIDITKLQAEAMNLPIITIVTKGEKEKELDDLKKGIEDAIKKFKIEGIVTGAVESVYQATRIQKMCDDLKLWCFNPLWQMDQIELLNDLILNKFEVIITGIAAYPLNKDWLGKKIDKKTIEELKELQKKYKINPAGEGGETESLVLNAPMFQKKVVIKDSSTEYNNHSGRLIIKEAYLE